MAAATNNLLLTTYDLDEFALDLGALADAIANMTPVADGATTHTFRFTWDRQTFVLVYNGHSADVVFTIAGTDDVNVPGYGQQDMADLVATVAAGEYGVLSAPKGYASSGIITVVVTYTDNADDGDILAGAFRLRT